MYFLNLSPLFPDKFLLVRPSYASVQARSLENAMISDPNIHETGEQAARALHSISDDECCFQVCSEDTQKGICTKCKEPWKHGKFDIDPATAPQCDPQSGSTGRRDKKISERLKQLTNCRDFEKSFVKFTNLDFYIFFIYKYLQYSNNSTVFTIQCLFANMQIIRIFKFANIFRERFARMKSSRLFEQLSG